MNPGAKTSTGPERPWVSDIRWGQPIMPVLDDQLERLRVPFEKHLSSCPECGDAVERVGFCEACAPLMHRRHLAAAKAFLESNGYVVIHPMGQSE